MEPSVIPDYIYRLKSSPGEFVLKYFGTGDFNWMSRLRCFPYRFVFYTILHLQELIEVSCPKKTSSGPVNDPYFVAQSYIKFAKKKKISKTSRRKRSIRRRLKKLK